MELKAKPDFSNVVQFNREDENLVAMKELAIEAAGLQLAIQRIQQQMRIEELRLRHTYALNGLDQISIEQEVAIRFERPVPAAAIPE